MPAKKILIIKMSSLGDLFHALPTVHALKTQLDASIDWVTNQSYVNLVKCFTDVDRVIGFPRQNFFKNVRSFLPELRREEYDLIIDLQGLLKSALAARAARGKRRIGPSYSREGARFFYDETAGALNKNRHAIGESLDVVRCLGLTVPEISFPVAFPEKDLPIGAPRVALVPCSRRAEKNWPLGKFIEVGHTLLEKGAVLYVVGSSDDKKSCDEIEKALNGNVVNLCGKTSLIELGSCLQAMNLVVTVDSGPMHMAAALGIPVVAIFGPTDPIQVGPYGPGHRIVRAGNDIQSLPVEVVREACLDKIL